jgi:hypothetical protein
VHLAQQAFRSYSAETRSLQNRECIDAPTMLMMQKFDCYAFTPCLLLQYITPCNVRPPAFSELKHKWFYLLLGRTMLARAATPSLWIALRFSQTPLLPSMTEITSCATRCPKLFLPLPTFLLFEAAVKIH